MRSGRNVESAPLWQEQITRVVSTGPKTSHWIMESDGKTIEWDSEVMADDPGERITWRSIGGDSDNAGEVIFEEAPGGRGTIVTVLQEFRMGKLTSAWETLVGRNPKQAVIENLRHFKALAETGEIPRVPGAATWRPRNHRQNEGIYVGRKDNDTTRSQLARRRKGTFVRFDPHRKGAVMKAVCWRGTSKVETLTVADPTLLNPHDAIIKTTKTAICGSDLHLYDGFIPTMEAGDVLGHEFMGIVEEVGKDVSNLRRGDRVVVPIYDCMRQLLVL
jgi:hypothetical protein